MNNRLRHLFDVLENERHQLLEKLGELSSQQLNRSSAGKWSVAQIVAHLIAAEKISVDYINKKIRGISYTENTSIMEEVKMIVLRFSQRLPFKFKAPAVVVERTQLYSGFSDLKADWDTKRSELKDLLEKFEDHQLRKKIYRHIRLGELNIQHALIFFREHTLHHLPQIDRLLLLPHTV